MNYILNVSAICMLHDSSEKNSVLTMRNNLHMKITKHFLKFGATKLFCKTTFINLYPSLTEAKLS